MDLILLLLMLKTDSINNINFFNANHFMQVINSLEAWVKRHRKNKIVRRRGRLYVINPEAPRYKARQG